MTTRAHPKYLLLLLLCIACRENNETDTAPPPLYAEPITVEANPEGGYITNTVTGDTIEPIILYNGDTLQSGIPIPVEGKAIDPDSVSKPETIAIKKPDRIINAHPHVHKIPDKLTVIPVNHDSLLVIPLPDISDSDTSHYFVTSKGDTIRTGIPLPVRGKEVPAIHPPITTALPPRINEAAIADFQNIRMEQGMASSSIMSMLEDKYGNLWFGTFGGGVSKYDGHSFTHFSEKEGLSNGRVFAILEDKNGNLWFGTDGGGVCKYDGQTFTRFAEEEGLSFRWVLSLLEDRSGNIWIGSFEGGLIKYDGHSFTHFTEKEGLGHNKIRSISEDKNGDLWFATPRGVCKFDGHSFTHLTEKDGLISDDVGCIFEDKNGILWFGTRYGLTRYDGYSFTHFTEKEGLNSPNVVKILEDKSGNLWFVTWGSGFSKYDGRTFTNYTEKEGLGYNNVISMIEDSYGNLWLHSWGGGVTRFDRHSFTHIIHDEDLSDNAVYYTIEDKNGDLWFALAGNGVLKYDGHSFIGSAENNGLNNISASSMLEDKEGNLWFGGSNGISKYDGHSLTRFTTEEGLSHNNIYHMLEDKKGNLWICSWWGGLMQYDGRTFTHFTQKEGLADNIVNCMLEDRNGNLWISNWRGGLIKYDGHTFTHFTEKEGLSNLFINCILEDESGNLWFGSEGGVSKYDGHSFTHFTEKAGLSHNYVMSSLEDNNGNLWFGTQNGLTNLVYGPGETSDLSSDYNVEKITLDRFGRYDGLKGVDFIQYSAYLDSKNRIWWGDRNGLTMLDMNKFSRATEPPAIFLRQLEINEEFFDYRNISDKRTREIKFSSVQEFENYPLELELPHHKNHLTFHYSAIDWSAPHKIHYSYKMDGLDDHWSQPTQELKADYRNVPFGNYTFRVRSIGESGEWSEAHSYAFTINPPWWHTWWAWVLYIISAMLALYLLHRWRTSQLRRRQTELENEVELATTEIRKEKERSDELLLNILPAEVAEELKEKGRAEAQLIDQVTVLFTDFKEFTAMSEQVGPKELVNDLNECFSRFDHITARLGIEKIKTIGDAYMAAGGLPVPNTTHATDVVRAALEIRDFIEEGKAKKIEKGLPFFEIRIGVHTGPVVAGIVGVKKFQYDIWGDTVNTASRIESNCEVGKVNISQTTYELLKDDPAFAFESRGKIETKGKGKLNMYYLQLKEKDT